MSRTIASTFSTRDGAVGSTWSRCSRAAESVSRRARVLLRVSGSDDAYAHVGGQLVFGPGALLYVGVGDDGDPSRAQDLEDPHGKTLALNVRAPNPAPAVAAYGLRNPWRFSFDKGDVLFVGDVGGERWEEVDRVRIRPGAAPVNLGWPAFEGPSRNLRVDLPAGAIVLPVTSYPHSGRLPRGDWRLRLPGAGRANVDGTSSGTCARGTS